jgi:hypothetical protein
LNRLTEDLSFHLLERSGTGASDTYAHRLTGPKRSGANGNEETRLRSRRLRSWC